MRRVLIPIVLLLAAAAADAATRASASGRATVTILAPATASVALPTHIGDRDDLRSLNVQKKSDPHSAAWLEMRPLGEGESARTLPPRSDGAIDLRLRGPAAARLAVTYHQF